MRRIMLLAAAGAAALASVPAQAERDPDYEAARAAGLVGEKMDGYLGIVGEQSPELKRIVAKNYIQRKDLYTSRALAATPPVTVEEYALTAGCVAIAKTQPGEKYQAPDGSWRTRGADAPLRDSRCPALQAKNRL